MSDLNPPAFDPRQLVLPSVLAMLHEVERLLPPHPQANVIQAQHVLAQMGQALESVQLPGPAHLIATMAQVVQQHVGNHPQGEHSSDGEDPGARALALLRLADQDLRQYLQALEQGHDSDSQTLFDAYRALVRLGGKDSAHPADLWHPRGQARLAALPTALSTRAPSLEPSDAVRAQLDQTVLAWVKTGERALAEQLCQMCLGLSHTAPTPALCSAWQLLAGWLDAQAHGLLAPDMYAKRLAARLLMLYGQQLKGMQEPTAALLHEALFFCDLASRALHGPAASTAAICAAICQSCQLLPCLDAAPPEPEPEPEPEALAASNAELKAEAKNLDLDEEANSMNEADELDELDENIEEEIVKAPALSRSEISKLILDSSAQIMSEFKKKKPNLTNFKRLGEQIVEHESGNSIGNYALAYYYYHAKKPNLSRAKKAISLALKGQNPPEGASSLSFKITLKSYQNVILILGAVLFLGIAPVLKKKKAQSSKVKPADELPDDEAEIQN